MSDMQTFSSWILSELPDFLMAEPVCYFVAIIIMAILIKGIFRLTTRNNWG